MMRTRSVANSRWRTGAGALLCGAVALSALTLAAPASSETKREREKAKAAAAKDEKKKIDPIDERTTKKLAEVYDLFEQEKWSEAAALLDTLSEKKLGNYGRALVYQLRGGLAARNDDYAKTAEWYEKAVAEDSFTGQQDVNLRYGLGQIYIALQRWEDAIKLLKSVMAKFETPNGEAYFRLALAYYQRHLDTEDKNDAQLALEAVQKAVDIGDAKPKEAWLRLLMALRWERKELEQCIPLLQKLVIFYPKKDWWVRLAAIYFELDRNDDAILAMQLADFGGYLDRDSDLRRLVQMEVASGMPYKAAVRLERGIEEKVIEDNQKTWELLGSCWLAARELERAVAPLAKAAEMSDDGDSWMRLARVHYQREEWDEAIAAIEQARSKGKVDKPGQALLIEGFAEYNQKDYDDARRIFERALGHATEAAVAEKWLAAVDSALQAQATREEARRAVEEMRAREAAGG